MVTSHDVARAAGVSQATVSRVLNGNASVNPAIRDRVLAALDHLGYVPNASAKSMRTSRSNAIGVVAAEMLNPYFPQLIDAITREARALGLNVILWNDDDPSAPMARAGVASGTIDGVLFTTVREHSSGVDAIASTGVPVVLLNRGWPDSAVDQLTSDHEHTGYRAAEYLLSRGRTRLAAVFGPRDTFASPMRERGFRRRLQESGITIPDEQWLVGQTSYEHGRDAAQAILEAGPVPDAIYCSADLIAFGVLGTLRAASIRVPEDVWVMGNDGLPMSEWQPFDLTTFRQPHELLASRGMERLMLRLGGDDSPPEHVLLPTELIVRGSTAHA